jgi:MFS family permease
MRRTFRYYYEDGLVETAVGTLFIIIGIALLGWHTIELNPTLGIVMVILSTLLIFGGTLLVQKILPKFKERFVHPRTGQVTYRQDDSKRGNRLVLPVILAVFILTLFLPEQFNQMALFEGTMLGAVFAYLGYRANLPRFYLLGVVALLIGVAGVLLFNNDINGSAFTFGTTGLIILVSGLAAFNRYLRRHPQAEAANE